MSRTSIAVSAAALWCALAGHVSHAALTDGLVAYYPFNGNALDASGSQNHGQINGSVSFVTGAVGQGARFHGVLSAGGSQNPDHIRVLNSSTLQFGTSMTVSYWVRFDGNTVQDAATCAGNATAGVGGVVLGKSGDRNGFVLAEGATSSSFSVNPFSGGGSASATGLSTASGSFRHQVVTVSGPTVRTYVNGVLANVSTIPVDFSPSNNRDIYIGAQYVGGQTCLAYWQQLDGVVDELRIHNRALSASEAQQLYVGTAEPVISTGWTKIPFDFDVFGLTIAPNNHIYLAAGTKIVELGSNLSVVQNITIPNSGRLTSLAYLNGGLWVGDIGSASVYRVDLATNTYETYYLLSNFPDAMGTDGQYLYIQTTDRSGRLAVVDPASRTIVRFLDTGVPDPTDITWDGNKLVVIDESGGLYAVDRTSGQTTQLDQLPSNNSSGGSTGTEGVLYAMGNTFIGYGAERYLQYKAVSSVTVGPLLSTRWNQDQLSADLDNDGNPSVYVPGCTAVAVGQLINHYFKNGYASNWLDVLLQGTQVYPKVEVCNRVLFGLAEGSKCELKQFPMTNPGYTTLDAYADHATDVNVKNLLLNVAIGLDSEFGKCKKSFSGSWDCGGTSAGSGPGISDEQLLREYGLRFNVPVVETLLTLMHDRFRFSIADVDGSSGNEFLPADVLKKVKSALDSNQPVFAIHNGLNVGGRNSGQSIGHATVIDGYRTINGYTELHVNFGWGDECNSKQWRRSDQPLLGYTACDGSASDVWAKFTQTVVFLTKPM